MLNKPGELNLESDGIQVIEGDLMKLVCFQTFTKIKFIFVVDKSTSLADCDLIFRKIYDIYSDYVSKNPFYEVMRIFILLI
jgi:hypothetical protein